MKANISNALESASKLLIEAENAKHLDGTVYFLGKAQTELLMVLLVEIGRLNDYLESKG